MGTSIKRRCEQCGTEFDAAITPVSRSRRDVLLRQPKIEKRCDACRALRNDMAPEFSEKQFYTPTPREPGTKKYSVAAILLAAAGFILPLLATLTDDEPQPHSQGVPLTADLDRAERDESALRVANAPADLPAASPANEVSWLEPTDYPFDALQRGLEGDVGVTMIITADGRPRDCAVSVSSSIAELDNETCGILLRKARFSPIVDDDGAPSESRYRSQIIWRQSR